MGTCSRLVLPPRAWQEEAPRLAREGRPGLASLARNFHRDTREWIVTELRPMTPASDGTQHGPLDELLVLRLQSAVVAGDARRLGASFRPLPGQLVVALVLGHGDAAGRWEGVVCDHGRTRPLDEVLFVGPGMRRLRTRPQPEEPAEALERWSRTRGALGDDVWKKVRASAVAVIGAGRNGSVAAVTLAMLGVRRLVLVDGDRDQLHNLDATLGARPSRLGRPKVVNRAETLRSIRPADLEIEALPYSLRHPRALQALRGVDLLVTCVDRDTPRLAAALLANRRCKVHLDIGTGVFNTPGGRQRGGDVRLLLPGRACVACLGGLRNLEAARLDLAAPRAALRHGHRQEWQEERAGSLLTINQMAVSLGTQLWLDLLAGTVTASRWCRLEVGAAGMQLTSSERPAALCELCRGPLPPGLEWAS